MNRIQLYRQEHSVPKLIALKDWLEQRQPKVDRDSKTGKAIGYTLNQFEKLTRYCEHGALRISNILAENAIRPFVIGRKAWMFADTPDGARASAIFYTLIETAKANNIDPFDYLLFVISGIGAVDSVEGYEALLPWNMKYEGAKYSRVELQYTLINWRLPYTFAAPTHQFRLPHSV